MSKNNYRKLFPAVEKFVYFDNAALTLKPKAMIDAGNEYYSDFSISTRTADSKIGILVNQKVKLVREKIANLIDGYPEEIIFTSGTTESLNIFALMSKQFLKPGNEILISYYNHSSNIIPWIEVAKETGAKIVYSRDLINDMNVNTKIVAFSQVTNNLNQNFDIDAIYEKVQEVGALLVNDAAQAIAHEEVTLDNCDVIAFSANKFYGPTGLGVLAIKKELLSLLKPVKFGGGSVDKIVNDEENKWISKEGVQSHEPGTLNLAAIWEFEKSLEMVEEIGIETINEINLSTSNYLYDQLKKIQNVELASKRGDFITLFNIKGISSQDVASYLGHKDIYVRSGNFCSKLLPSIEDTNDYVRISVAFYNNKEDVDKLIDALKKGGDFLDFI